MAVSTNYQCNHQVDIAISLTPYQGLKPKTIELAKKKIGNIAISLTPYQGLKLLIRWLLLVKWLVIAISLTPYQGLKHLQKLIHKLLSPIAISLTPYKGLKPNLLTS